ncbi:MAG: YdcH family protein [Terriglobia bacterium]
MGDPTETVREQLMVSNQEFQRLYEEHEHYDAQLRQFSHRKFLSEQDQAEEIRLKKLKLRAKDGMEDLVHRALNVSY